MHFSLQGMGVCSHQQGMFCPYSLTNQIYLWFVHHSHKKVAKLHKNEDLEPTYVDCSPLRNVGIKKYVQISDTENDG